MTFTAALAALALLTVSQVEPTRVAPTPVQPTQVQPTTVQPTTVQPTPVQPTPVQATPVQPTPVEPTDVRATDVSPAPVNPNAVETRITLETTSGATVEGVLLDETATGYLVRQDDGTSTMVPYSNVKRVSRGVAAVQQPALQGPPPPAPATKAPAPAPAPAAAASVAAPKPSMMIGGAYVLNLFGRNGRSLAAPRTQADGTTILGTGPDDTNSFEVTMAFSVADWMGVQFGIGFDALGDFTYQRLIDAGACVSWGDPAGACFPEGANYNTVTLMGTLWLRAAYPLGPVRLWAGIGAAGAWVQGNYEPGTWGGITYGQFESFAFGMPFGAGVEWAVPVGIGGPKVVLFGKLEMGSPVYGADAMVFDDRYHYVTDAVGHAVDPRRFAVGVGLEL